MDFDHAVDSDWCDIKELIEQWGISHTTLEEVFMKVIKAEEMKSEEDREGEDDLMM